MPLIRKSNELKIADILTRIAHYLADKDNVIYSNTTEGILFQSENGKNQCVLSRSKQLTDHWVLECSSAVEDWTRTVIVVLHNEEALVLPEMIRRWCCSESGSLFRVQQNGQIPMYQACRTNGKNHRLPISVDYDEWLERNKDF